MEADADWRARLLEEGIRPEFKDATRRPWVSVGAENDDGGPRAGIVPAHQGDQLESVDARKVKIGDHRERRAKRTQNVQGARGVARIVYRTAVVCFQRHLQSRYGILAIFHQEDKWR